MPKKRVIDLRFPVAGYNQRFAYRQQPPYTTPDVQNVRPFETEKGRERGGSRPGLTKACNELLGSGEPIRLLADVAVVKDDNYVFWSDDFDGEALNEVWSEASWLTDPASPGILPLDLSTIGFENEVGVVRDALSIDTTQAYQVEMLIVPYESAHMGSYQIFCRMDNTTPVGTTDGVIINWNVSGATFTGTVKQYVSSAVTSWNMTSKTAITKEAWLKVLLNGTSLKVYWNGEEISSNTISASLTGSRIGFGMSTVNGGDVCLVDAFRVQYYENQTAVQEVTRRLLVASSGGSLYAESKLGEMTAVSTSLTLSSDRQLCTAEWNQQLFIADYGDIKAKGTNGVISSSTLDSATYSDWTTLGIDAHDDVVVITNGAGGTTDGTYQISTVAAGAITLSSNPGNGTCSFRIERAPKVYDPDAGTLAILAATTGTQAPTGCSIVCRYRDRLVWAGNVEYPHQWWMSRQGDAYDYDYEEDADDMGRAASGQDSEAGAVGEPIRALIPHTDDYLVFGCDNSLWVMRGDTTYGGQIDNLDHNIGIVDKKAWCRGPSGETIFLSRDGLYVLAPGGESKPVSVSREMLPRELRDIDRTIFEVCLAYDVEFRGVHIYITVRDTPVPAGTSDRRHYWFDWAEKGFWPVRLQGDHDPLVVHNFMSFSSLNTAVLLGCKDGYIRKYADSAETDDGTEIESWITIGPIRTGGDDYRTGIVGELIGVLGEDSGDVDWNIQVADTAEAVVFKTGTASGTFSAGISNSQRPRLRGGSFILKLENGETDRSWSIERMSAVIFPAGKQRV